MLLRLYLRWRRRRSLAQRRAARALESCRIALMMDDYKAAAEELAAAAAVPGAVKPKTIAYFKELIEEAG